MSTHNNTRNQEGIGTGRLETLTDGIFAIAMTLLVFGLVVPDVAQKNLDTALEHVLPSLLSLVISFLILGVLWVATNNEFRAIRRADHTLIWLNLFFLLSVTLLPFSAGLLGRYPTSVEAVTIYGGNLLLCLFFHLGMWLHATRDRHLVDADLPASAITFGTRLALFSIIMYSIAIIIAFFSTGVSLILYTVTPIPYILGMFYRRRNILMSFGLQEAIDQNVQAEEPGRLRAENDL